MLSTLVRELAYVLTFFTGVNSIERSAQEGERLDTHWNQLA